MNPASTTPSYFSKIYFPYAKPHAYFS
jgi:hypothetical protein